MKKARIALPVMFHDEEEIKAFNRAKERIQTDYDAEVTAFVYLLPFALTEERQKEGIRNQRRYGLTISHMQTPIAYQNSLWTNRKEEETFGKRNQLEEAITYAARLIREAKTQVPVHADTHVGVYVLPGITTPRPYLGIFSLEQFTKQEEEITRRVAGRFKELDTLAKQQGLEGLTLENEPLATYESPAGKKTGLIFRPYGTPQALLEISQGVTTFDANHFAATKNAVERFQRNRANTKEFFELLEITKGWEEYQQRFCDMRDYLGGTTVVVHLSNTEGIGVHLTDEKEKEQWGRDGTVEGTLTRKELRSITTIAKQRELPIAIEVDYDIKNIPRNNYKEADPLLEAAGLKKQS